MGRAPFELRAGEVVAGYTIERAIGRGGSASVYSATHPQLDEPVAFKIMHEQDPSGVGRPRFAREAALLKKLRHPHVVEMLDYGFTESDLPFIVFELLRGRSLFAAIKRLGPFDPLRVGRIVMQILDALGAAHDAGIIHRDIKPGNIYLCAGHEHDYAQLLDLGLAKALEGDGVETDTITGTGYRLGTPRYMSPEMARGQTVGAPGDLYAVGLVMGEMLAGEPIVKGNVQIDVLMAHGSDAPLSLPKIVEESAFVRVIEQALDKDLGKRFASAAEMHSAVDKAIAIHERTMEVVRLVGVRGDLPQTGTVSDQAATLLIEDNRGQGSTLKLIPDSDTTAEIPPEPEDPSTVDEAPEEEAPEEEAPVTQRMAGTRLRPSAPPTSLYSLPPAPPPVPRPQRVVGMVLAGAAFVMFGALLAWLTWR
jgi:eukaryotic-like serine/threonine-protein kinase